MDISQEPNQITEVRGDHCHDNSLMKQKVREIEDAAIKSVSFNSTVSPRAVLGNITNNIAGTFPAGGIQAMRKTSTIARAVQREKVKALGFPKIPKSWEDMTVPDNLRVTVDKQPFLLFDSPMEGRLDKIFVFCSSTQKQVLAESSYWMGDGTFEICKPTMFTQVLIISASSKTGVTVPCVFAFLPGKEMMCYRQVFQVLKDNGLAAPDRFHSDFEKGLIQGFLSVYPDTPVVGCDTHWKRCLTTNLRKCGLSEVIKESISFQTLFRCLWALSLVPPTDVITVWENFISDEFDRMDSNGDFSEFQEEILEFMSYFERCWIGELNRRTFVRRKSIHPISWWNKYEQVRNDVQTTSNIAEGYNNAMNYSLPRKASIWMLIESFRTEEAGVGRKLHEAAVGQVTSNRSRDKQRDAKHQELKNLVNNYKNVEIKTYMYSLIEFFNMK